MRMIFSNHIISTYNLVRKNKDRIEKFKSNNLKQERKINLFNLIFKTKYINIKIDRKNELKTTFFLIKS